MASQCYTWFSIYLRKICVQSYKSECNQPNCYTCQNVPRWYEIWMLYVYLYFFSFCITIYWLSFSSFFPWFLPYYFSFFSFILFLRSFTVLVSLSLLYLTIRTHKQIFGLFIHSALPISRCHFSPNNSRRTPIARLLGRDMDVILEFEVLPKVYIRNGCVEWNIVLYCTAIYRESIVLCS